MTGFHFSQTLSQVMDVHGKAIRDYYQRKFSGPLLLHNSYGEPEEMPVEVFFRDKLDFTTLEHLALMECTGKVLDIGAGAGAFSLELQGLGFEVFALENSPGCVEVLKQSGIKNVISEDYRYHSGQYDTLVLQMNGLGIAGTIREIPAFLKTCRALLKPKGQILVDSSDIQYLYEDAPLPPTGYYGEVRYSYEYQSEKGDWFNWVYVDPKTLAPIVSSAGMHLDILHQDENDQYLARIYQ